MTESGARIEHTHWPGYSTTFVLHKRKSNTRTAHHRAKGSIVAHSLELLPDEQTDRVLRAAWARLADAGLRSRRRPASPTDRPHCTLIAAPHISPAADALLDALAPGLPLAARVGPPVILAGHGRYTLAASVVPDAALLALHAQASAAVDAFAERVFAHTRPGRWTAHLTLARRLTAEQVGAALRLIDWPEQEIAFTAVRRWDGDAAAEVVVRARPPEAADLDSGP